MRHAVDDQVDPTLGGWYPALTREGVRKEVDFARGKPDFYHPLGACLIALDVLAPDGAWHAAPGGASSTQAQRRDGPAQIAAPGSETGRRNGNAAVMQAGTEAGT